MMKLNTIVKTEAYNLKDTLISNEKHSVFLHHIYEYKKGLRNLILHTTSIDNEQRIEKKLKRDSISYFIYDVGEKHINVFFGSEICIDVIKHINKEKLSDFSDEEDFILGIMLGYDRKVQCKRYLQRKNKIIRLKVK